MNEEPKTKRRTATVPFNDTDVVVKELSLRQFQEFGDIVGEVEELANVFKDIEKMETLDVVKAIAGLMKTAPDLVGQVISKATDLTPDQVLDGTIDEIMELVVAIIKVNNFVDSFKKKLDNLLPSQ